MSQKTNPLYWHICIASAILITVITFTPLVIPYGDYRPYFLGMPYTLWVTILVTVLYVVLTFIGSRVHPGRKDEEV